MSKVQIAMSALSVFFIGKLEKTHNYHAGSYGLAFILKSKWIKMEKQDLQAGESQWQNSNSTTSYIQEQKTSKYESRKMALSQAQD